jgi:hypothetical protein
MPGSHKNTRDNSGHSGHPNKYRGFKRPESVSRVLRTRDRKSRRCGHEPGDSALDCAVATTRLMSWPERTTAG